MKKTISVKNNKLKLEYKLFELNEVAQYGFAYVSGDVLNPVSQKIFPYVKKNLANGKSF